MKSIAAFANKQEVKLLQKTYMQKWNNLLFGQIGHNKIGLSMNPTISNRNNNVFVLGIAGTGKTYNYIKSNLLQMNNSAVVIDVAGEYEDIKNTLKSNGYLIFNISNEEPDAIKTATEAVRICSIKKSVLFIRPDFSNQSTSNLLSEIYKELLSIPKSSLNVNIHIFLDEFCNLGEIPNFITYLSSQSSNISTSILVQMLNQVEILYPCYEQDILQFCDTLIFMGSAYHTDCDKIQKLLENTMKPENAKDKSLVSTKQIQDIWSGNKELVIIRNLKPFICEKLNPYDYCGRTL